MPDRSIASDARRWLAATLLGGALLLAGGAAQAQGYTVTINGMTYGRLPDVKVGDTVTWKNADTVAHTVTARDKSFDLRLPPGKSAAMTLDKAGTFPIICMYHPTMRGTLRVAPK